MGVKDGGRGASNAILRGPVYRLSVIGSYGRLLSKGSDRRIWFWRKGARIRQDWDGWDPLSVPLRRAGDGTRGLDSLGSDRGRRETGQTR